VAVLLNWVVQGLIVATAAAAGLRVLRAASARVRHGFVLSAYVLVLALPAVSSMTALVPRAVGTSAPPLPLATVPAVWWTAPVVAAVLCLAWWAFHGVRLAMAAAAVGRAKRGSRPCPGSVLDGLPHWRRVSATGRRVPIVLSERVRFAAVLGWGRPVVAVSPDLIERVAAADLDRILVHEWAHVQRRDDVAQIAREIVRAFVGWHPALWWLEHQMRRESEAACDETAVSVTGSARDYAAALVTLAVLPQRGIRPLPVLGAVPTSGARHRVVRILALDRRRGRPVAAICAGAGLLILGVTVSNVRAIAMEVVESTLPAAVRPIVAEAIDISSTPIPVPSVADGDASVPEPRALTSSELESSPLAQPPVESAPAGVPSLESTIAGPLFPLPATAPVPAGATVGSAAPAAVATETTADRPSTPWAAAATAGVAVGRASQSVGLATAGFFSPLGKHIARSF
jgi:bla regulator protein blaR1